MPATNADAALSFRVTQRGEKTPPLDAEIISGCSGFDMKQHFHYNLLFDMLIVCSKVQQNLYRPREAVF